LAQILLAAGNTISEEKPMIPNKVQEAVKSLQQFLFDEYGWNTRTPPNLSKGDSSRANNQIGIENIHVIPADQSNQVLNPQDFQNPR
jgi:hypothetical protein